MHTFSLNAAVRPNLPLRKPSSGPTGPAGPAAAAASPRLGTPGTALPRPAEAAGGDGMLTKPVQMDKSSLLGFMPPALTVYFCNFCGQQGNFRCKRCKRTPYCSVGCQTEDWKAHRHVCKAVDPEPAEEAPKEAPPSPVAADRAGVLEPELQLGDGLSHQRVFMKDLPVTKVLQGADVQVSVQEVYSPGRFFVLVQSPELLEALQSISLELQRTNGLATSTYEPCSGEVCAVQFSSDMNWYRGLIQTLSADQKSASVLYIDFGNEEAVPVERIRPLSKSIQPCGPCALECSVAGVVPVGSSWSRECCMAARQILTGKVVRVKLVEALQDGRVHKVDVQLATGKQLSSFLIEQGFAAEETVDVKPSEVDINAMFTASLENFKRRSDGTDDNSWAEPPEPLTQAVGDAFSVVVTHIESPAELIVQKVENAGVIQQLQVELREHCTQIPAPVNFRPAPGTVCCAQFSEDKQWYRAKVLAYSSEDRVCVGYLDFGNSEEVDLSHLRPISPSLLALPMQAMPCGLAGVQPVGESWSKDCVQALQRRVSNRILRVQIQGAHQHKALVSMIDEASDPQADVAELLRSADFAAAAPVKSVQTSMQTSVQTGVQTSVQTAATAEAQQAREPLTWSRSELPCDGRTVKLLTSMVENPGEFYCHINNPTERQRLVELRSELKQHCEAQAAAFEPKVGDPCCTLFPGDGAWYRAVVSGLVEEKVWVNLVDYGHSMKVEKQQLRSITAKLLALPFQAVRCWLSGVEPLGSEWSSEALLWFQTQVDGEELCARVLSVSERGYGVELQSRGQDVAAALISVQLAKAPGETAGGPAANQQPTAGAPGCSTAPQEAPSFPVDWRTVELPINQSFQPYIAGTISPSLFYLLSPKQSHSQEEQQKLQEVMMELSLYCTNNQASASSPAQARPEPGAACCAQFSADNNWYRAVVLAVGETEVRLVYADYGNTESVPLSRLLPIPPRLLQRPFQIARCSLHGKERFPAERAEDVQEAFRSLLLNGVLATVQAFDGSANVLSLTLPAESGGRDLTATIYDALQAQAKQSTTKPEQTDSSSSAANHMAATESQRPTETQRSPGDPTPAPKTPRSPEASETKTVGQTEPPCRTKDSPASGCCCSSLQTQMEHLEELMQLQLSLLQQLQGQSK